MSQTKPSSSEEEFFARENAEKLHRLHAEKLKAQSEQERAAQKQAHFMKCPKCGCDLQEVSWRNIEIDKCFSCGVIVLDDGELEKVAGEENEGVFLREVFELFKR